MVSALAYCSEDPCSNHAVYWLFHIALLFLKRRK